MSPKLKPLVLPHLVKQRKLEVLDHDMAETDKTYIYYTQHSSSSSSDLASPATPTFTRSAYSRYSGSASSLEQMPPLCHDSAASPAQIVHSSKGSKSQLPDVQEDPLREMDDTAALAEHYGLYGCLCRSWAGALRADSQNANCLAQTGDKPCSHRNPDSVQTTIHYLGTDVDYDMGFLSDGDFVDVGPRTKRRRAGSESTFNGWGKRIGSRFPTLTRWRSMGQRNDLTFSPASEPSLDQPARSRAASQAASSRSSISAPARRAHDRSREQSLLPTPAMSMYGSTDSIVLSTTLDVEDANAWKDLERDRALAATPLLPPLLTDHDHPSSSVPQSLQASPLHSPTVAPVSAPPIFEASAAPPPLPQVTPTPPLSSKPSVSSFRPVPPMSLAAVTTPTSETPSPIPNLLEHDEWSDRLGHANFTIVPRPYQPATANLEALSLLRVDWDLARINYTKHLVRTGEHYGATSNTYALTQEKWAGIEREWHSIEDDLIERIVQSGNDEASATLQRRAQKDVLLGAIPAMLDAEGKFPERGDVDIVGPMERDAVMAGCVADDKKNVGAWLKNLAEKVGLRK